MRFAELLVCTWKTRKTWKVCFLAPHEINRQSGAECFVNSSCHFSESNKIRPSDFTLDTRTRGSEDAAFSRITTFSLKIKYKWKMSCSESYFGFWTRLKLLRLDEKIRFMCKLTKLNNNKINFKLYFLCLNIKNYDIISYRSGRQAYLARIVVAACSLQLRNQLQKLVTLPNFEVPKQTPRFSFKGINLLSSIV